MLQYLIHIRCLTILLTSVLMMMIAKHPWKMCYVVDLRICTHKARYACATHIDHDENVIKARYRWYKMRRSSIPEAQTIRWSSTHIENYTTNVILYACDTRRVEELKVQSLMKYSTYVDEVECKQNQDALGDMNLNILWHANVD